MNEFNDPELERMLGRASGAYPDANVAFEVVRGRVRQVRRRRAIMASTAACAMLFGVVALAVRGGESDANLEPSHSLSDHSSVKSPVDSTDATDSSMVEPSSSVEDTTGDTATTATVMGSSGGSGSTSHHTGNTGKGGSNSGSGDAQTTTTTATTTTATAVTVSPADPAAMVTTYSSAGGSLEIQVVNNRLVLVAELPAAGYAAHNNEVGGDRIRVEFSDGKHMYEIQLQLSDGKVSSSTQSKG